MTDRAFGGFSTRAIHAAAPDCPDGDLVAPLHLSATFTFETAEEGAARFAGAAPGHFYSRISNPTLALLENRIADLEGTEAGLALASGMGALTAAMWTLLSPGDELLTDKTLYGCTFAFFRDGLSRFGVTVRHVDMTDAQAVRAAIGPATRVVYFETPANPNMRVIDIAAIAAIARAAGAVSIVDNTYATPYLTRPAALGADLVLHSATKYLGGHGDLVAGLLAGPGDLIEHIRVSGLKDMTGAAMAPFNAMLILRGLKTLALRMDRHCATARKIADTLICLPGIAQVHYPGHGDFAQHAIARRQMRDFGGMIAFEMTGGAEAGRRLMNNLGLIRRAVSLGDAETLIQHPASMTHATHSPEERAAHGISEGLVRLSVGLEDADDLLSDLRAALSDLH